MGDQLLGAYIAGVFTLLGASLAIVGSFLEKHFADKRAHNQAIATKREDIYLPLVSLLQHDGLESSHYEQLIDYECNLRALTLEGGFRLYASKSVRRALLAYICKVEEYSPNYKKVLDIIDNAVSDDLPPTSVGIEAGKQLMALSSEGERLIRLIQTELGIVG